MTSSYALDTATDQAWEKVVTHAAAALRAVEDTALIGRAGDEERPWGRPVGTEVPPKLWPALAAYAARTQLEIVRSDTDGQPEQRRIAVGGGTRPSHGQCWPAPRRSWPKESFWPASACGLTGRT